MKKILETLLKILIVPLLDKFIAWVQKKYNQYVFNKSLKKALEEDKKKAKAHEESTVDEANTTFDNLP